ncbi:MAG: MotA/TolQ/ExbB proton channel family protein [Desulfobulbaceae bacterium]|nr:MotA/TolQ/ExbB proton channel family protein [Desulfobulbaceae bacterium]
MTLPEQLLAPCQQLADYLRAGGIVMLPLIAVSVLMWLLIVERALFIRRLQRRSMSFEDAGEHLRSGRLPRSGASGGITGLLVQRFLTARSGRTEVDRYILDETVTTLQRSLSARLPVIGVLAAIAPLLGLLGTVLGMIATFEVMAIFGTGNARAMAGGISEALISTQTGLLVAIPGLYMKGFLDRRAGNLAKHIGAAGLYLRRQL